MSIAVPSTISTHQMNAENAAKDIIWKPIAVLEANSAVIRDQEKITSLFSRVLQPDRLQTQD